MTEKFHGEWWNAVDPSVRLTGTLSLGDEGTELSVFGQLTDARARVRPTGPVPTVALVHGITVEGDRYTLVNSWRRGLHLGGDSDREQLSPEAAMRGAHLDDIELRFDRMMLRLDNLVALADDPSVDVHLEVGDGGWPQRIVVEAERQVVLEGRFEHERVQLVAAPEGGEDGRRRSVGLDVYYDVVPDEPAQWQELVDGPASRLIDLTTLATTHPAAVRSVKLHSIAGSGPASHDRVWIDLLLPFRKPRSRREDGWLVSFERLFSVEDAPEAVIDRWGEVSQRFQKILPLAFGPSYASFIYDEHRFVSVCQAVEALHDLLHDPQELSPPDHQARVGAVLAANIPPEHAAWVKGALQRSNSVSFARKVRRVLEECPPVAGHLDVRSLARSITKTRNPLSHGALSRAGMLENPDRHWVYVVLRFTISWYLLAALGMPADEASKRINRHNEFRHAVDVLPFLSG